MMLSIIIPCRDDPKLAECVRSIDADVEVLVALNGSPPDFRETLKNTFGDRVRILSLARANRSRALEVGIRAARYDRVLLMDSDCVFARGALAQVEAAFESGDPRREVYKGRIVFDRATRYSSAIVACSRSDRMAGPLTAFKPPLAFSREIVGALGGYFFDPRMLWKEDADFDQRVRRAEIRIVSVDGCVIHHAPLSMKTDLKSGFGYGAGESIARHISVSVGLHRRSVIRALRRRGVSVASYLLLFNVVRTAGILYAQVRLRWSGGRWLDEMTRE